MSQQSRYFYYPGEGDWAHYTTSGPRPTIYGDPEDYSFGLKSSSVDRTYPVCLAGVNDDSKDLDNLVFNPLEHTDIEPDSLSGTSSGSTVPSLKRRREQEASDILEYHGSSRKKMRSVYFTPGATVHFDISTATEELKAGVRTATRPTYDEQVVEEPQVDQQSQTSGQPDLESEIEEVVEKPKWKGNAREVFPESEEERISDSEDGSPNAADSLGRKKHVEKGWKGMERMEENPYASTASSSNRGQSTFYAPEGECSTVESMASSSRKSNRRTATPQDSQETNMPPNKSHRRRQNGGGNEWKRIDSVDQFTGPRDEWIEHTFHTGFWEAPRTPTEEDPSMTDVVGPLIVRSEEHCFATKKLNESRTKYVIDRYFCRHCNHTSKAAGDMDKHVEGVHAFGHYSCKDESQRCPCPEGIVKTRLSTITRHTVLMKEKAKLRKGEGKKSKQDECTIASSSP